MTDPEDNNRFQIPPPSYETAVGSSRNDGGTIQTSGKSSHFPPSPQPSGYPAYQPQTVTSSLQNPSEPQTVPVIVGVPLFGSHPCNMTCPNCNKAIVTEMHTRAGLLAFIICGVLLLFGCWAGCCLIPFCVTDCLDVDHICPNCKVLLGTYKRI